MSESVLKVVTVILRLCPKVRLKVSKEMAEEVTKLERDNTMVATAKVLFHTKTVKHFKFPVCYYFRGHSINVSLQEGEAFLEAKGGVDEDAKTRGQQKEIEEITSSKEEIKRTTTMAETAKVCSVLFVRDLSSEHEVGDGWEMSISKPC